MPRHRPLLLLFLAGCARRLDTLDGHDLGDPAAVVWAENTNGEAMVVFSNIDTLCDALASSDPPETNDWWVVSATTTSPWKVEDDTPGAHADDVPAVGYARWTDEDGDVTEYRATFATLGMHDTGISDDTRGRVWLSFDNGDEIEAIFTAQACDADLFLGQE